MKVFRDRNNEDVIRYL